MTTTNPPLFPTAIELKPGTTYGLELSRKMSHDELKALAQQLSAFREGKNIDFVILEHGIKIKTAL